MKPDTLLDVSFDSESNILTMNTQRAVKLPSKTGQPITCQDSVESSVLIQYEDVMPVAHERKGSYQLSADCSDCSAICYSHRDKE